jgi:hypothetical protein
VNVDQARQVLFYVCLLAGLVLFRLVRLVVGTGLVAIAGVVLFVGVVTWHALIVAIGLGVLAVGVAVVLTGLYLPNAISARGEA